VQWIGGGDIAPNMRERRKTQRNRSINNSIQCSRR